MKLTNSEALQAQQALTKLQEVKLPIKASIDIALLMNTIEAQIKAFGMVRDKLYKTYSIKDEPGEVEGTIRFTSTEEGKEEENLQSFMEEFSELLETKTEDFSASKIKLPDSLEIEPSILKPLTKLVEVE